MSLLRLISPSRDDRLNAALVLLSVRAPSFAGHVAHMCATLHGQARALPIMMKVPGALLWQDRAFVADTLDAAMHMYASSVGAPTCLARRVATIAALDRMRVAQHVAIGAVGPADQRRDIEHLVDELPAHTLELSRTGHVLILVLVSASFAVLAVDVAAALARAPEYRVVCTDCGADENMRHLLLCGGCEATFYCSRACQRRGRGEHRPACALLRDNVREVRERADEHDAAEHVRETAGVDTER